MNVLMTLFRLLAFSSIVAVLTYESTAQSIPNVPLDIDFLGVTVHLNEQSRLLLQDEVRQLYADRAGLQRDIESLRQLTPLLEPILKAEQLPVDYRYAVLPFGSPDSTGYWGLTQARALSVNMVVNDAVDERFHPILSTRAVTAYLSRLRTSSDNYVQPLVRYLRGDTLASHPADTTKSAYLLLDLQSPKLIWKIIARKLAFEREEPVLRPAQPYLLYDHHNAAGYSLRTISRQFELDEERFKPFNAWLKADEVPDEKDYSVLIRVTADEFPIVKSQDDLRWKPSEVDLLDVGFPMLTKRPQSTVNTYESAVFYTINNRSGVQAQPCDNVITLAHYGKIGIKTLLSHNELSERDVVQAGQIYYLERKAKRAKIPFHIVRQNQTLRDIANVYGIRLKSILRFNRLKPTQRVQTGRILWLRTKRPRWQPVEYRQQPIIEPKPAVADTLMSTPSIRTDSLRQLPTDSVRITAAVIGSTTVSVPDEILPEEVTDAKDPLPVDSLNESKEMLKLHVVQRGQTYYSISQLYGVTLRQLYDWNNLSERIPLKIGQELIVDLTKRRQSAGKMPKVAAKPKVKLEQGKLINAFVVERARRVVYHVVRPGQTVYRVALINKVSIPDLMRWNNLKNYTIEVGQKLLIQKGK